MFLVGLMIQNSIFKIYSFILIFWLYFCWLMDKNSLPISTGGSESQSREVGMEWNHGVKRGDETIQFGLLPKTLVHSV